MASVAQFFFEGELIKGSVVALDEATAKHIVQVLRKQKGDTIKLSNGKGYIAFSTITATAKKQCTVTIDEVAYRDEPVHKLHIAVAFTKNSSRNEWLLEKATELGASSIIPLSAKRTEKEHIRYERWNSILVSAMLQSQGYYLPELSKALDVKALLAKYETVSQKLVAHCIEDKERMPLRGAMKANAETLFLIGPEGDFTYEEVECCEAGGCTGISLGTQRLRTETAAMAACAYFNMINNAE